MFTEPTLRLTHAAVLEMLRAAVAKAEEIGQPQCIVIVDVSGETLGQLRMNGARFLSLKSARSKARTASSTGAKTTEIPESMGPLIAAATGGEVTRLKGGFPILIEGQLVGGIGVGTGSPEQDEIVARAALTAVGADAG